jgi:hypothetical protein
MTKRPSSLILARRLIISGVAFSISTQERNRKQNIPTSQRQRVRLGNRNQEGKNNEVKAAAAIEINNLGWMLHFMGILGFTGIL